MRSSEQALAAAYRWHTNQRGMCLYTVQRYFDAPWSGPYAEWAWHHWGGQHPGDKHPPPGVPVYWHNPRSKYGHIAIATKRRGWVRSTDWPGTGRVNDVSIDQMSRAWGLRYLGWSDTFSGGRIAGIGSSTPPAPHHHRPTPPDDEETTMIIVRRHPGPTWALLTGKRITWLSRDSLKGHEGVPIIDMDTPTFEAAFKGYEQVRLH